MFTTLRRGVGKDASSSKGRFPISLRVGLAGGIWLVMAALTLAYAKPDMALENKVRMAALAIDEPAPWLARYKTPIPEKKPVFSKVLQVASVTAPASGRSLSKADLLNARWAAISQQMEELLADPRHCLNTRTACDDPAFDQWITMLNAAERKRMARRLPAINRGINATLSYTLDRVTWGATDYWASPAEALQRRRGDCEDYAILKYWSLALLGFDRDSMEVVAVFDQRTSQYHAVLRITHAGATYILDNRTARIRLPQDIPFYKTVFTTSEGADFSVASNFRTLSSLVDIATSGSN